MAGSEPPAAEGGETSDGSVEDGGGTSERGTDPDEEGESSSGGAPVGPPNQLPPGHFVQAPDSVTTTMRSTADYDGDGKPEFIALERISQHNFTRSYVQYGLNDDDTAFDVVGGGGYSRFEDLAAIFPGHLESLTVPDAVRVHDTYSSAEKGLVVLSGGAEERPLFPIDGDAVGDPTDVDLDGWVEFAWEVDDQVRLFEADGEGSFVGSAAFDRGCDVHRVLFGDLNGDDYPEAIAIESCGEDEEDRVRVHTNTDGQFEAPTDLEGPCAGGLYCIADLDNDGNEDLVARCDSELVVHRGNGDAGFAGPQRFASSSGDWIAWFSCDDFDGDASAELIISASFAPPNDAWFTMPTLVDDALEFSHIDGITALLGTGGDLNGDGCADISGFNDELGIVARISEC